MYVAKYQDQPFGHLAFQELCVSFHFPESLTKKAKHVTLLSILVHFQCVHAKPSSSSLSTSPPNPKFVAYSSAVHSNMYFPALLKTFPREADMIPKMQWQQQVPSQIKAIGTVGYYKL